MESPESGSTELESTEPEPTAPESTEPPKTPRRRLSFVRVVLALALVAAVGFASVTFVNRAVDQSAKGSPTAWFAPYVDATLVPTFPFENPVEGGSKDVVLGFIVADRDGGCAPTWGTYVDLDGAATSFDLDRRITRLRAAGGNAIVSFGGLSNSELALRCDSSKKLAGAYAQVIDRYELTSVDFDIEGEALSDEAANKRRGEALKQLQDEARKDDRELAVWLTLPVAPQGLTEAGLAAVEATLATGVNLAGVNVMTMNYGASRPDSMSMAEANQEALRSTYQQLDGAYERAGQKLQPAELWGKIGATPMVGTQDTTPDQFTISDAESLIAFAKVNGLGRLSLWSANRDGPCGSQMDELIVSNTCSGVEQEPLEYSRILNNLTGRAIGQPAGITSTPERPVLVDDALTSPYPIWQESRIYVEGQKIVWHGNVYVAKWWTKADRPDERVKNLWDSPWRYLGPVMPNDLPAPKPDLPNGTYPAWNKASVYAKGKRVLFQGMAYQAKWYTQGDAPSPDRPWETPWQPVSVDLAGSLKDLVASLPDWSGAIAYEAGSQIRYQGVAYEATRWNQADAPGSKNLTTGLPTWKPLEAGDGDGTVSSETASTPAEPTS